MLQSDCYRLLTFFKIIFFKNSFGSEHFGSSLGPDVLSVLFRIQTVFKGYQQTRKMLQARKEFNIANVIGASQIDTCTCIYFENIFCNFLKKTNIKQTNPRQMHSRWINTAKICCNQAGAVLKLCCNSVRR